MKMWRLLFYTAVAAAFLGLRAWAQPPGDVDGNGIVGAPDAALAAEHVVGSLTLDTAQLTRANCNGETGLDCADIVWILNHTTVPVPEMVLVSAGSFMMGDPWNEGNTDERPVHSVMLSAYEIGRYDVTNAEYCAYLNAALANSEISVHNGIVYGGGRGLCETPTPPVIPPKYGQIVYSGGTFTPHVREGQDLATHPVVMVSWFGGAAYCNWLSSQQGFQEVYTESGFWASDLGRNGYHLPTEAQWERAAAWDPSDSGSSTYPAPTNQRAQGHWRYGFMGDSIEFGRANYHNGYYYADPLSFTWYPFTSPVGFYNGSNTSRTGATVDSPSPVGCYDMSGNVFQWCNDLYSSSYYSSSPSTDPTGPTTGSYRVLRGGSWYTEPRTCRSAFRNSSTAPHLLLSYAGFRLARTP